MDEMKTEMIDDADFHEQIDRNNLRVYRYGGEFVNIVYRGAGKTTRTKLFVAFVISNDLEHRRRYFKILTKDLGNGKQAVTDIYNLFVSKKMRHYYPEIFQTTVEKRMETMSEFDTSTKIKVRAGTVGQEQRGQLQDDARPDFVWFDDFETRKVLRSATEIGSIWGNMEEARTGLSRTGGAVYTCNYLSERGNVHKLIKKYQEHTLIIPIKGRVELHVSNGNIDARHLGNQITWPAAYTIESVARILHNAEDPAGEYLSCPAAGDDVFFQRARLDKMEKLAPIDDIAGFKIFEEYDPSHRYASGHDVAGGVGLDSSTSVFIDFSQNPNRVVATFKSNRIQENDFGDEIKREARYFGYPVVAPENNNYGHGTIARLLSLDYENIYTMKEKATRAGTPPRVKQWGWNTNAATKTEMFKALRKAVKDGHLELSDPDLIAEARAYTRDDLMDTEEDPRLTTRHFDLLIACAIAWQMRGVAEVRDDGGDGQSEYEPISEYENTDFKNREAKSSKPHVRFKHVEQEHDDGYVQPPYEGPSEYQS